MAESGQLEPRITANQFACDCLLSGQSQGQNLLPENEFFPGPDFSRFMKFLLALLLAKAGITSGSISAMAILR